MLISLHATNFRRHELTHIDFSNDAQIVAITGRNGHGKSTLLEMLLWALYGESRHGRRQLAGLVRRGAEHEGMAVELELKVGGVDYKIVRRWEKGKHSAALFANHDLRVQTADGVTSEVTRILGMDSVGFRLATIAKQKELDGLADLTSARRKQVLTRLLRLDAVQAAAQEARNRYNRLRDVAEAVSGGPSVDERQQQLDEAVAEQKETDGALEQARANLLEIDTSLAASADIDKAYTDAQVAFNRAEAIAGAAAAELSRARAELDRVVVPEQMAAPQRTVEQITVEMSEVDTLIARGEAAATIAQQARHTTRELDKVSARITQIEDELGQDTLAAVEQQLAALSAKSEGITGQRRDLLRQREELLAAHGTIAGRIQDLRSRLDAGSQLGDVCDTCEQSIPAEHKHTQQERRQSELDEATASAESILKQGTAIKDELEALDVLLGQVQGQGRALSARQAQVTALTHELDEARTRHQTYTEQLERLNVEEIDLDDAYARKGKLACERTEAEAYESNAAARAAALARRAELEGAVAAAAARKDEADAKVATTTLGTELLQSYAQRQEQLASRELEREMVEACAAAAAGAAERVNGARRLLEDAQAAARKVAEHRTNAEVAAKTHRLLTAVSGRMATQIRPALEGQISAMLQTLSEGRFTAVKVSDDYEVTVADHDGRYYPVAEFSGGEADLIALAIRLALAQVVSARHGVGGAGFLILDEVFGSQDDSRRLAILEGLRRLRPTYGQILLISHVGGIEDAADTIIDIHPDEEDPQIARVSVA